MSMALRSSIVKRDQPLRRSSCCCTASRARVTCSAIFDYGAPTGFRLALRHPERITAIISQNGNAYEEGLSNGWTPIRTYWEDPSQANRNALRAFLTPETTRWQYTHGVPDPTMVSPDGQNLDDFYLARPGADEIQLDLFGDYKSNVDLYPSFQKYFRISRLNASAPGGRKNGSFMPHTARNGGCCATS
jgi:pimeloyl-ACP methyl ester carboxylesterase